MDTTTFKEHSQYDMLSLLISYTLPLLALRHDLLLTKDPMAIFYDTKQGNGHKGSWALSNEIKIKKGENMNLSTHLSDGKGNQRLCSINPQNRNTSLSIRIWSWTTLEWFSNTHFSPCRRWNGGGSLSRTHFLQLRRGFCRSRGRGFLNWWRRRTFSWYNDYRLCPRFRRSGGSRRNWSRLDKVQGSGIGKIRRMRV